MKRFLTFVCAVALSLGIAEASLVLQERFDRPTGTLSASTWSGGSIPSDGNWHTYSPGTVQFQVVAQQLTHDDYCTATTTNAVQYTEKGSVNVRYDYLGDNLIVSVEDTGRGIPKSSLSNIFERFVTGANNGAGLGLSICHELIQRLGGTININSDEGKGTIVWFSIPCQALEIERS